MNAELARILDQHIGDPLKIIKEKDGVTPRTVVNPHVYSKVFDRLVHHPKLVKAAQEILGERVYVFQSGLNCKELFNGDVWFWHQDYPAYQRDDHIPEPRMVNALIFFDDINSMNGPLMIVPGSHLMTADMPENSDQGTSYSFRYTGKDVIEEQVRKLGCVAPTGPAGLGQLHECQCVARLGGKSFALVPPHDDAHLQRVLRTRPPARRSVQSTSSTMTAPCRRSKRWVPIA